MTRSRRRPSESSPDVVKAKRLKISHVVSEDHLTPGLLLHSNTEALHLTYVSNTPYKFAVIEKLFREDLLKQAKDECLEQLHFTEKETDIYKVNQTGDLASLSYLTEDQVVLLPSLLTLRDTLYSPSFRSFIRAVTGCGPLSGSQQDMSVNTYKKGCHLLNHDDVIGSRRVSYILYMPLPYEETWQKEWGGALELYPTVDGVAEPLPVPEKSIPPSWNQFIFFEVQPGKSFHSVEEVVVGGDDDNSKQRLSISGWFHAAQPGEEGYEELQTEGEAKSSREQLTSTSTVFYPYPDALDPQHSLSSEQVALLSKYLNPEYLRPNIMEGLAQRFVDTSSLDLYSFLNPALASTLEMGLRDNDSRDGLGSDRSGRLPPHEAGTSDAWIVKGPPHKWRYCTLKPQSDSGELPESSPEQIIRSLQDELFSSGAFQAWLLGVSRLVPLGHSVEARRFRPGLDYTLATSEEKEARLDVVLGLTPNVPAPAVGNGKHPDNTHSEETGWQTGEWGGWECYMAPNEDNDDPAVYRTGKSKKANEGVIDEMDVEEDTDEEEEEDGTLLTVQPGFNRLLIVLRDEGVMRFVKYVSAAADGSRWDICGEYEVGMLEIDDDENDSDED